MSSQIIRTIFPLLSLLLARLIVCRPAETFAYEIVESNGPFGPTARAFIFEPGKKYFWWSATLWPRHVMRDAKVVIRTNMITTMALERSTPTADTKFTTGGNISSALNATGNDIADANVTLVRRARLTHENPLQHTVPMFDLEHSELNITDVELVYWPPGMRQMITTYWQDGGVFRVGERSTIRVENTVIIGGHSAYGGTVSLLTPTSVAILKNVVIDASVATHYGGAFFLRGNAKAFLSKVTVSNCRARWGGAAAIIGSLNLMDFGAGANFINNTATEKGNAFAILSEEGSISSSTETIWYDKETAATLHVDKRWEYFG